MLVVARIVGDKGIEIVEARVRRVVVVKARVVVARVIRVVAVGAEIV
jgi:hypothetical protein